MNIEKGIPIPPRAGGKRSEENDLMRTMEPGDSILSAKDQHWLSVVAARVLGPGNFTVRTVEGGNRLWRTR